ncbi:recombinase family protein [Umezawaea sp. Da 62-37]|uniref:recombinase family protein n=1 Tax=Umezawaea sp. Da 62-37 TaxID=3075927 RepID=UPI0028F6DBD5|nr:recombinase family protein [Umezawaea sp. Da 62-37]WNV86556.1 recombinase family protein [Umezawaea sp. Da 62-37]
MTELFGIRYVRASQDRWGNTVSVDSQEDEGEEFFDENAIIHVATHSDNNLSGSLFARQDRDSYELALADLKSGKANLLWTWDSSRAQRDLEVYTRLRRICIEAGAFWAYGGRIYDMRDPKDRQDTARDAVNAEGRADEISMNSRRGVKARAKKGKHAGPIAYGYRPTYSPETGRSLGWAIVDEESKVIRRIVNWLLDRKTLNWVAKTLNAEGVPCPRDSLWNKRYVARLVDMREHPVEWAEFLEPLTPEDREWAHTIVARVQGGQTLKEVGRELNREGLRHFFPCRWDGTKVKNIALSPPSAGLRRHHGEVVLQKEADPDDSGSTRLVPVKTTWNGIKTHDEHAKLVALLNAPERKTVRDGDRAKHRWSGISQCGVCKGRTTVVFTHGKQRIRCKDKSCVTRDYTLVDAWLTEQALLLLEREDAAQLFRIDDDVTEARTAQKKAEELRARLDSLRVQAMEGKITAESFGIFETDLLPRIEKENEKAKRATLPPALVDIIGTDVRTVFMGLAVTQQREILRAIMRPKVLPTKRKARGRLDTAAIDPGFRYSVPVSAPEPAPDAGGDTVAA